MNNKLLSAFYWLILGLMMSAVYIYKQEAADFGRLFVANLMPGLTVEGKGGVVKVAGGYGGHFYINTELNGVPVKFLVDTGASNVCITREIAVNAGIDISKLVFNQVFQTANGAARGAYAKVKVLKVGSFEMYDVPVSVSETGLGTPLLGMTFLNKLKSYTFEGNSLYLHFR